MAATADPEQQQPLVEPQEDSDDEHDHYSHRAPWLRAMVLGANDGLVSVASLMMGIGGANDDLRAMQLAGIAGLVGGALSMACGEYISVSSQKDAEEADIEKERQEQMKGPAAKAREFEELVGIYMARGLSEHLARAVAHELTEKDVIRAHARDELGIDIDDLAKPMQASVASAISFALGAAIPLLTGAFIVDAYTRLLAVAAAATFGLALFGGSGAYLGGAPLLKASLRVLIGGWLAMAMTFGIGKVFGGHMPA